jgi:hypothetical protein
MHSEEKQTILHSVALKSATRILLLPKDEIDDQTAQSPDVVVGTAGKLLALEGKSFRSTDVHLLGSDCIASKQFLALVDKYSLSLGQEALPVVSVNAADGSIKVLGLAICAGKKITMYRDKFMPLCEPDEGEPDPADCYDEEDELDD